MSTPLGAVASRISAALARRRADRALRISTQVWGDVDYSELGRHAIAADDAAFLAASADREGRHDEARDHARYAREQYRRVKRLVQLRSLGAGA